VGGFALSQYFLSLRNGDRDTLRSELQSRLSEISASAARLENARLGEREQIEMSIRRAEALRLGEEGAAASVVVVRSRFISSAPRGRQRGPSAGRSARAP